jgi:RNA polymerase primary sigma factor
VKIHPEMKKSILTFGKRASGGGDTPQKPRHFILYESKELPPLLTVEQEVDLAKKLKSSNKKVSDDARELFITSNLRLVIKIAQGYMNCGLDLEDLVGEGNIGLFSAVERFDPSKGAKFSTYAAYWIRQRITRSLSNDGQLIRMPVYLRQLWLSVLRYEKEFEFKKSRPPTDKETAKNFKITVQKVIDMKTASGNAVNLDASLLGNRADAGDSGSQTLNDVIPDTRAESPLVTAVKKSECASIEKIIKKLNEREQCIINSRFGLQNNNPDTLENIGKKFNITRERVRQIEKLALSKIKALYLREISINTYK